jgi:SAM-dependent methyltransferase
MSDDVNRLCWEDRYREGAKVSAPEPWVNEMMALLPRGGLALDVAAGAGRHSVLLARAGFKVVAIDYAEAGLRTLQAVARAERLTIWPVVADLGVFPLPRSCFDVVLNVSFLDRALVPRLAASLKPNGTLLFDTFLIDQLTAGHPRNPEFLLKHYELREMLDALGMRIVRYREGLTVYRSAGKQAWRAAALATRQDA